MNNRRKKPTVWDRDLEWLLCRAESALGARSSLASQIALLERGGAETHQQHDPYTDRHVGWGPRSLEGSVARERRLRVAWRRLPSESQRVLLAHYTTRLPTRYQGRHQAQESWQRWPRGTEAAFGQLVGVALYLAHGRDQLERVLTDCAGASHAKHEPLATEAHARAEAAHDDWRRALQTQAEEWAA